MEVSARPSPSAPLWGLRSPPDSWRQWARSLRRHHLDGLAAWLLEAGRPLALISAQMLYMALPFLGTGAERLARLLESDVEAEGFAAYLESDQDAHLTAGEKV